MKFFKGIIKKYSFFKQDLTYMKSINYKICTFNENISVPRIFY